MYTETLKLSRYVFIAVNTHNEYVIYSTLNGFLAKCVNEADIDRLKQIQTGSPVTLDDTDFIKTLYDNQVLIDTNFDEEQMVNDLYRDRIENRDSLELMLIMTKSCNFRCIYCSQEHETDKIMSNKDLINIRNFIERKIKYDKIRQVSISYFGGEPLLELNKIILLAKELQVLCQKSNILLGQGMSTNAYLLTPENFEKLMECGVKDFQISIDGAKCNHDKTRVLANGHGTWDTIISNLHYMKASPHDFKVTLRTNYNKDTLESISEFYTYVKQNFDDDRFEIYFESIKKYDNCSVETVSYIEELLYDVEIVGKLHKLGLKCANMCDGTLPCSMVCQTTKPSFYTIDYDMTVRKCSQYLLDEKNVVGKLSTSGEIVATSEQKYNENAWNKNYSDTTDECKLCKLKPLCYGKRCPSSLIINGESLCNHELEELRILSCIKEYY